MNDSPVTLPESSPQTPEDVEEWVAREGLSIVAIRPFPRSSSLGLIVRAVGEGRDIILIKSQPNERLIRKLPLIRNLVIKNGLRLALLPTEDG